MKSKFPTDTYVSREVRAGCFVCHDVRAHWISKNAQAVAARHARATGHETWSEVIMGIRYVPKEGEANETKLDSNK